MTVFLGLSIAMTLITAGLLAVPLLRQRESSAPIVAVAVALLVPAATVFLYLSGSNYDWQSPPSRAASGGADAPAMADAIAGLEARLQQDPDDLDGWLLLGNSYLQTQRLADAESAYARALALSGGANPYAKLGLAEARVLQDRNALAGDSGDLVEQALAALPDDPRALWYGGLAALARQDTDLLRSRWSRLLDLNPPEPIARVIREQLTALGMGAPAAPAVATAAGTTIDVEVSVTDALSSRISPGAVLFLAARNAGQPGPPLAAIREQAANLPRTLQISDANAMIAGRDLSQAEQISLVARVSNNGTALAQPGDIFGEATWQSGDGPVSIVINQVVQE
ncbi:MAG: hypothetical protein QNJ73_09970 [Gammaproteobacteria bacterium]|nr:hypothetical protein [Gammaproteobacteria bacterium]